MIYLKLLVGFMYIGVLAFGGGYAALPLIQEQCINVHGWLSMTEFSDLLTISQITPGPIAINSASFVGMKVAGIPGAVVASLGFILPPFVIVSILFWIYNKYQDMSITQNVMSGLRPAVIALIAVAAIDILIEALWSNGIITLRGTDVFSAVLALVAFLVLRKWHTGAITTILSCGAVGILKELIEQWIR